MDLDLRLTITKWATNNAGRWHEMSYSAYMYWKFRHIFVKMLSPVVGKFIQDVCDGQVLVMLQFSNW